MSKKFKVSNVQLDEVSIVDYPMNQKAHVVLYKSGSAGNVNQGKGDNQMDPKELAAQLEKIESENAELKKSVEQKNLEIKNLKESVEKKANEDKNQPEMIDFNGDKIAKSAVPEPVLKMIEKQNSELNELKKRSEEIELTKRGDSELPYLSGSGLQKGKLLKAVDNLEAKDKEEIIKSLKAANAILKKSCDEVGSSEQHDSSAKQELDKKVAELAIKDNITKEQAFVKFISTDAGKELRKKADNE